MCDHFNDLSDFHAEIGAIFQGTLVSSQETIKVIFKCGVFWLWLGHGPKIGTSPAPKDTRQRQSRRKQWPARAPLNN